MAQIHLEPPSQFNFHNPEEWRKWKKRFEQYRSASKLDEEPATRQVSTLLYCLGKEAEAVLESTNATVDDKKNYGKVIEKLDSYFEVCKNVIYERARFNRRSQLPGESAEQYIMQLYRLAETCNYGDLEAEMIRDRLVVGIRNGQLSERLQLDPDLTLEKAKKVIRQQEAVHQQQETLKGSSVSKGDLDEARFGGRYRGKSGHGTREPGPSGRESHKRCNKKRCTRCGKEQHPREKCPAKDSICHKCNRKGHYAAQCYAKTVSEVQRGNQLDTAFLDTMSSDQANTWMTTINLDGVPVTFKMDTGAEVTAISDKAYKELSESQLSKPNKILYGPSRRPLPVVGQFRGTFTHKGKSVTGQVYVIKGLKANLLGLPTITALNLMVRMDMITHNKEEIFQQYPSVFNGLGNLGEEYEIQLKENAKPFTLYTPRRVPLPLQDKVQQELNRMESLGVISKVDKPTEWCAGMVVIPKKAGTIRICVDLKPLNESVLREIHPLPRVDDTLAKLHGAKIFSKLDANSGFWQIPLAEKSKLLTTFITPSGRYCFNKLPFGISSAPEHFQKRMNKILHGLDGVLILMDDILVFGRDQKEHDSRLKMVLQHVEAAGVTLNREKCEFSQTKLVFLGHLIDNEGIRPDPEKTTAITQMQAPTNVPELRRFLGMVNQLGKFSSNLAELTQPLRELLSKKNQWTWNSDQDRAFTQVKAELTKPTVLALYNPKAATKIAADASSYGLGAVLLQEQANSWKPVSYASRSMTETERRYAQIEKEALATTWACEKFSSYILGKRFVIETDHKPLVPLLGEKNLDSLPPRILRFRLRLARFDYSIIHIPGKFMYTADALSWAPVSEMNNLELQEEAEALMEVCISQLRTYKTGLEEYQTSQAADPVCSTVMHFCRNGWPTNKKEIAAEIMTFWKVRGELTVCNDLLLYRRRVVIPKGLQKKL